MIIYGLMKFTEYIPWMYDFSMNLMTFGNHSKAHNYVISKIQKGQRVLDIGCGTGDISIKCAEAGADVTAVDASPQMLEVFEKKLSKKESLKDKIKMHEIGAGSVSTLLKGEKFDIIIMSMMLGELSTVVRKQTLKSANELLKDDGKIIINDELWPENKIIGLLYTILFIISFVPNFLLTRTLIRPVKGLKKDLTNFKLKVTEKKRLFLGVISIMQIVKA